MQDHLQGVGTTPPATTAVRTNELREAALRARVRARHLCAQSVALVAAVPQRQPIDLRVPQRLPARHVPTPDASRRIAELLLEVEGLREAMRTRAVIEQAKGVIIGATGCTPDVAFQMLVRQSQYENRKLREIAASLVASKSRFEP
jgi:hypothetical protein